MDLEFDFKLLQSAEYWCGVVVFIGPAICRVLHRYKYVDLQPLE